MELDTYGGEGAVGQGGGVGLGRKKWRTRGLDGSDEQEWKKKAMAAE